MIYKKEVQIIIALIAAGLLLYLGYWAFFTKNEQEIYRTENVQKRTITQVIKATGFLESIGEMRLSPLIAGNILKMYVEEDEPIKKGQLLADIDDGKGDTELKEAQADLNKSQATLKYEAAYYDRQKKLYEHNHISKDAFELATQNYDIAVQDVELKKATLEKVTLNFNNKKIISPTDGVVIEKISTEGESVTVDTPPAILYKIAKDITKMKARIDIDESVVGYLQPQSTALLTFDTYPNKTFSGPVTKISKAPQKRNSTIVYLATVPLDNSQLLFRPGMTVNARITVAEKENVIAVPGHIFKLSKDMLNQIAQVKKLGFKPLVPEEKEKSLTKDNIKTIWLFKDNAFVEHPVEVGINDNAFFEIVSGLDGSETLVIDTAEPDVMKKFFERVFGKGL